MRTGLLLAVALVGLGTIAASCSRDGGSDVRIESPDGALSLSITASDVRLAPVTYRVEHHGRVVLDESRLGILLRDVDLSEVRLIGVDGPHEHNERYSLVTGKQRDVEIVASRATLHFAGPAEARLDLHAHVANDGAAFRYEVLGVADRLAADLTSFAIAAEGQAWIQPHDLPGWAEPAYEQPYVDGVPIGHSAPIPGWALPALFAVGDDWVLLAESDLREGGYGSRLGATPNGREYELAMPHPAEGRAQEVPVVEVNDGWLSSWRVIVVGTLADVVETNLITDLARRSQIEDTSWIRPGRVSWSWWSDHTSPTNPAALRDFIDFSAEMGWEHTLIDANWNTMPDGTIEGLIDYATERDVGVFLWYNSGGPNNVVTEQPRDRMYDQDARRREMAWLADVGVAGIKVDFFHSDWPEVVDVYLGILADAAENEIMVNFHGSTVPRGWTRTWPHLMTMEAVRGAEQYSFRDTYPAEAVWHNTILPFTRNVVGPMDYTPTTFSNQVYPRLTTAGHELALAIVYESGLQHLADSATSYRSQPAPVLDLLRALPAVWDETRLVAGHPGSHAVIARRHRDSWYIGAINGPNEQTLRLDMGFVGAELRALSDPGWATETVGPGEVVVTLPAGGGWVAYTERLGRRHLV